MKVEKPMELLSEYDGREINPAFLFWLVDGKNCDTFINKYEIFRQSDNKSRMLMKAVTGMYK